MSPGGKVWKIVTTRAKTQTASTKSSSCHDGQTYSTYSEQRAEELLHAEMHGLQ